MPLCVVQAERQSHLAKFGEEKAALESLRGVLMLMISQVPWCQALMSLAACGHRLAAMALPSWLGLHSEALKQGPEVFKIYGPVLLKAARSLRDASVFAEDFHEWSAEEREGLCVSMKHLKCQRT